MWDEYLFNLTSNRRYMMNPYSWNNSFMNTNSVDRFFDRIERLLSHPDIKVEKRKTVSFTVTEGDNETIDRAIEILESLRASEETTEENNVDTESSNESYSEEFKGDNV
jgi:hypothetical protein